MATDRAGVDGLAVLAAALEQIELHPETWNQTTWACGTQACLAGWMARLDPEVEMEDSGPHLEHIEKFRGERWPGSYTDYVDERLPGLGRGGVSALTNANNTMEDLRVAVQAVIDGEDVYFSIQDARKERRYAMYAAAVRGELPPETAVCEPCGEHDHQYCEADAFPEEYPCGCTNKEHERTTA